MFFFCTVFHLFALMICFGDQVLSPGFSLATNFLGVVPLWRVAQRKIFQTCPLNLIMKFSQKMPLLLYHGAKKSKMTKPQIKGSKWKKNVPVLCTQLQNKGVRGLGLFQCFTVDCLISTTKNRWVGQVSFLHNYCNPGNFRKRLIFVLFVNSGNLWKLIAY